LPAPETGDENPSGPESEPAWNRDRPFPARLAENRRLTATDSDKDVRHFVVDLRDSGIAYEPGDALGVWPENDPNLVRDVLDALGFDGSESVPDRHGRATRLDLALRRDYDITRIPRSLLAHAARESGDAALAEVVSPTANGALDRYLRGRDVLDLLREQTGVRPSPSEFVALLRKIQPRLYSIASSPKLHPTSVHLCVNVVRYAALGRARQGLASAWLADRVDSASEVPVYIHANPAFRPPSADQRLIMIGPGTGVAPFRAFLQERRATGARGLNWLFFGAPHARSEFLYADELRAWEGDGLLHRLDLAWSRDQDEKVYVQHRMREQATILWDWLESGAAVYVCGDASRMAKDVDAALHDVIRGAGGRSVDDAAAYVNRMVAEGRYRRDVY
ncbi:MAG: sulfite reductase subunit alpha, partial [Verrucomicrobiales bacterium]|nr:sulfite reductase subunit alpha [Verrucomicrobiales bacterium]